MSGPQFRTVLAVHPHWKGSLKLSSVDDQIEHEGGGRGIYSLSNGKLLVNWNEYGQEIFVEVGGIFVNETLLRNAYQKLTQDGEIPSTIFQTWKSKISFPDNFKMWRDTFAQLNPSFEMVLWDDDDNREFIKSEFPWFYEFYMRYPGEIYRADVVRYFFLYRYGGIYADLDVECLRSLDGLRREGDVMLGQMGTDPDHSIPNAIMASKPKEEFWLLVIWIMLQIKDIQRSPEYVTGPVILKSAVDLYQAKNTILSKTAISTMEAKLPSNLKPQPRRTNISILPANRLYPLDWTNPVHQIIRSRVLSGNYLSTNEKNELFPDAWMTTYWSHSW
ncbi:putative Inositol phosphorylceramide mannosyltransferase [Mesorhizobium escarrei]|uniref:Inositol phosphorylceramide mannosyltransferase n=1 Tax=Mesorhizobium escarrei TaxID=666018 RepID=A0ABM9EIS3_9HYPH|nr:putative Inositol phosphorylceramide mannosyltransferase [Mesorhizobium escarrei]